MMDGWYKGGRKQIISVTETDRNGGCCRGINFDGTRHGIPKSQQVRQTTCVLLNEIFGLPTVKTRHRELSTPNLNSREVEFNTDTVAEFS